MTRFKSFDDFAKDTRNRITSFCNYSEKYLSRYDSIVKLIGKAMKEKNLTYDPDIALTWVNGYIDSNGFKKHARQRYLRTVNLLNSNWDGDLENWKIYPSVFRLSPKTELFIDISNSFETYLKNEGYEEKTIYTRIFSVNHFLAWLENNSIYSFETLDANLISSYLCSKHFQGRKASGVSTEIIGLRKFLIYLEDRDIVKNCHGACLSRCNTSKRIVTTYSDSQIDTLFKDLPHSFANLRNKAIFMLALKCGLRSCDIMNLKFDNIDFENKKLTIIQKKTKEPLSVPFDVEVSNALIDYILNERPESALPYIFLTVLGPVRKLTHTTSYRTTHHFNDEDKPQKGGLHILRRTYASKLLSFNIDVSSIAKSLGHKDLASVDIYLSTDELKMRKCGLSIENFPYEGGLM